MILIKFMQVFSWIDPVGQYYHNNLKNAMEAKDLSAWALRGMKADKGKMFKDGTAAANEVSNGICIIKVYIEVRWVIAGCAFCSEGI